MKNLSPTNEPLKIIRPGLYSLARVHKPGSCTAPECKTQCFSGAFFLCQEGRRGEIAKYGETPRAANITLIASRLAHERNHAEASNKTLVGNLTVLKLHGTGLPLGTKLKSKAAQKCAAFFCAFFLPKFSKVKNWVENCLKKHAPHAQTFDGEKQTFLAQIKSTKNPAVTDRAVRFLQLDRQIGAR